MTSSCDVRPARANSDEPRAISERAVRATLVAGYGRIRNYLRQRINAEAEAEEVLQAFMLRALERSADLRDADSVRGWLSRVLATTIADFHRQRSKNIREEPFGAELSDRLAVAHASEEASAVCECLYSYLPLLKTEQAEVIKRIELAGESREFVAAEMGVTVNNVTVRLHRARLALKGRLQEMCVACLEESYLECGCG